MNVSIVNFPQTNVALITHTGNEQSEHDTVMKLVQWKIQNRLLDQEKHRHYGLHYLPQGTLLPHGTLLPQGTLLPRGTMEKTEHKVDFCLSVDEGIAPNKLGISPSVIPACRCALARDVGSRMNNQAVRFLLQEWLPESNETLSGAPVIFHYVNVGPNISEYEAITDVYLPLYTKS